MKKLLLPVALIVCSAAAFAQSNVGIGTNSPASKLDVKGNLTIGDSYTGTVAPSNGAIIEGRVGLGTSTPDANAALDVTSTDKGVLIPRIALVSATNPISSTKPAGLMVYNTSTTGTYATPGLYIWDGTTWTRVIVNTTVGSSMQPLTNATSGGLSTFSYNGSTATQVGIAPNGIVSSMIGTGEVQSSDILDNTITANDMGTNSVDLSSGVVTNILPINKGGTNTNATPTAGGIAYGNGTAYGFSPAGNAGEVLRSNGTGAPSWSSVATMNADHTPGTGISGSAYDGSTAQTWSVTYGTTAGTAVQGNQTATITAGTGLTGGISNDALGDGFNTSLSVNYGTTAGTAVQGNQTATISAGAGLTGGISSDALGDGFSTSLSLATVGTAGSYTKVTTDAYGRVTSGTNPTTLAGYGITDAAPASGSGNYIQNGTAQQASSNFNISGNGTVGNNMTATTYLFPAPTGDPSPVITARVVPAGQGASAERTELILFHGNDPINGSGEDLITLRAPALRFQTYNNAAVGDINNVLGSNDRMYIRSDGNVGIGTSDPQSLLHVMGKVNLQYVGINRFEGLDAPSSAARQQLVMSSNYSDLVIASTAGNDNHGSTLTFATYNPSNAADYRKFVVNQGNWGARRGFLDFGYSDANGRTNPHSNINGTDNVVTMDGFNKRLGIATMAPQATLEVNGVAITQGDHQARGGLYTRKRYYYYTATRTQGQATTYTIGAYDFCALAAFSQYIDEDDGDQSHDTQCNVYGDSGVRGDGIQAEGITNDRNWDSKPTWYMYVEAFGSKGSCNVTCSANCINFDY